MARTRSSLPTARAGVSCAGADAPVLDRRTLNRTLLARQCLLRRTATVAVPEMLEHLVGMQAQEPQAPYLGLWNRLDGFRPEELSDLIANRKAVRGWLMRSTIHLVSAADYCRLWPLMRPVLAGGFRGSQFSKELAGVDIDELLEAGCDHLAEHPSSRAELSRVLAERWPGVDAPSLAFAINLLTPVLQLPPRGLWRRSGQARLTVAETWLHGQLEEDPSPEGMVRRYLAGFGPATVADIQAWCGLTRVAPVLHRMRATLRTFRDEDGNELFDVPDAPIGDPEIPAAPRLLAAFDNVILAHSDRRRIIAAEHRNTVFRDRLMRAFLVDGFVAGTWRLDDGALQIAPIKRLRRSDRAALTDEAQRLLEFIRPGGLGPAVRFASE
jgi:Winged helix DNA-binding domain